MARNEFARQLKGFVWRSNRVLHILHPIRHDRYPRPSPPAHADISVIVETLQKISQVRSEKLRG